MGYHLRYDWSDVIHKGVSLRLAVVYNTVIIMCAMPSVGKDLPVYFIHNLIQHQRSTTASIATMIF